MDRRALEQHLGTLGLRADLGLALDATITPDTLLASDARGPASPAASSPAPASVGPLPRIALSGLAPRSSSPPAGAASAPSPPESADLEVIGVLGEGGMGRVHLARQRSLGREVAIKTLKHEVADVRAVELLRAEATTMGRLEHPNVVPLHAVGRDDAGQLLLVMKRIEGVSWRELLRDPAHPRWSAIASRPEDRLEAHLDVLGQVATALHFAHGRGVVHRDVKPENVLLGEHGEVYLADWGIAGRIGAEGPPELLGTPAYMAPEMVVGDPARIDARTDVFLLGATLHEVLTGAPPHDGPTVQAVLLQAYEASEPVYGRDVPAELAAIARRAMAPRPDDRFPSALAFKQALDERRRHLGAIALLRSARALLGELEAAGGSEPGLDRKLTECRFAFSQALREWPESVEGRAGLDAVLARGIRHELARENVAAARALLEERASPDPALVEAVEAVEARLARRRAEEERLRALEAEGDLRVGLRSRMATVGAVIALGIGISAYLQFVGVDSVDTGLVIGIALVINVVAFGLVAVFRRHLLGNAAGRRVAWLLLSGVVALLLHRVIGAAHGVEASAILAMDLVLFAMIAAASGALVPRAGWALVVPVAGALATVVWPDAVPSLFSLFGVLTLVAVGGLWLWEIRSRLAAGR